MSIAVAPRATADVEIPAELKTTYAEPVLQADLRALRRTGPRDVPLARLSPSTHPRGNPMPSIPAVIVDLDGTVTSHVLPDGALTRNHHLCRAVGWDLPNEPVIAVVRALHAADHQIIFCSGRPIRDDHGFDVGRASYRWLLEPGNRVVALWRSLGITCLQVADGDF